MDYCRTVLLRLGAYPELGSACSERCRSDSALRLMVAPDSTRNAKPSSSYSTEGNRADGDEKQLTQLVHYACAVNLRYLL